MMFCGFKIDHEGNEFFDKGNKVNINTIVLKRDHRKQLLISFSVSVVLKFSYA